VYVPFLVDLFQDKGNVCFGLLNGTEINHGSTIIVGGIDDLPALILEFFWLPILISPTIYWKLELLILSNLDDPFLFSM